MSKASRDTDVLVIGAGMAGVATAWALRQVGIRTIVLEARSRIGGRIHSSREWPNLPCDLGASWVSHPTVNPLIDIARARKIKLVPSNLFDFSVHESTGHTLSKDEAGAVFALYVAAYAEVKLEAERRRNQGLKDGALSEVLPGVLDKMDLDTRTRRGVEFFLNMSITEAYATDQDDLSLYNWDDDYTEIFLGLFIVPDGYARIVEALAKGLDIRKEHVVTHVTHDAQGVVVTTEDQGNFRASHAVVAVPHGVLAKKMVKFSKPLPAWKQAAIDRIHTGLSDKFWFHFPRKFWKSNHAVLGRIDPDGLGRWSTWVNFHKYTKQPVLMCFNRTAHARTLEGMTNEAVVSEAMEVLRAEFRGRVPEPIAMQRSMWGQERFSQGTIPHLPPGSSSEDHRILARRVGRLRFAGDATHAELPGEVVGAFWSGVREAEKLACEYRLSPPVTSRRSRRG